MARGVKPGINRNDVYALHILLPALDEQKRIVAALDQTFGALDGTRAHVEGNLTDAQVLFTTFVTSKFSWRNEGQSEELRSPKGSM